MMKRARGKRAADKAIPKPLERRKDRVEAFEKLRKEGLTLEQIGERFKLSRQRVHQILKKGKP
jgi:DNA-directed RNA polymerase sigma subunit (sigma70/sigma32)